MAPGGFVSVAKQAELLKQDGNLYFKKDRIGAAIEAYTQAITLCPNVPVYWTNRALCHRKRDDWAKVEADCRKALDLDNNSVKAHYMLGLALLQSKQYVEGVKQLDKALELGRGGKPSSYMVEEIWQELAKAKYLQWESSSCLHLQKLQELRVICERALQQEHENAVLQASETEILPAMTTACAIGSKGSANDNDTMSDESTLGAKYFPKSELLKLESTHKERCEVLSEVFWKAMEADIPTEVPEYLCCKITLDIFRDPVITPSGVTYERAALLEHLQKVLLGMLYASLSGECFLQVGKFDPMTREPLQPEQLVSNFAIKEAVQAYLANHGWAYKMA